MNAVRFPAPPSSMATDATATKAARARELADLAEPRGCAWCGCELPPRSGRRSCSNACRSALARYERAMRAGEPTPLYRGLQQHPAGTGARPRGDTRT